MSWKKKDPIREKYFHQLEVFEIVNDSMFYLLAILSCLLFLVKPESYPNLYIIIQIVFILWTILYFVLWIILKLKFAYLAGTKRREDFFSKAFGVNLTHDLTKWYYNNTQTESGKIVGAQTMENSFFSKMITKLMLRKVRIINILYLSVYVILMMTANKNLELIIIVSQVIFTEQIFSKWIRMEWLDLKFNEIYNNLYSLFITQSTWINFDIIAFHNYVTYEVTKATGGITLSSSVFDKINEKTSEEWLAIQKTLNI